MTIIKQKAHLFKKAVGYGEPSGHEPVLMREHFEASIRMAGVHNRHSYSHTDTPILLYAENMAKNYVKSVQ